MDVGQQVNVLACEMDRVDILTCEMVTGCNTRVEASGSGPPNASSQGGGAGAAAIGLQGCQPAVLLTCCTWECPAGFAMTSATLSRTSQQHAQNVKTWGRRPQHLLCVIPRSQQLQSNPPPKLRELLISSKAVSSNSALAAAAVAPDTASTGIRDRETNLMCF